ncbi:NAD(P)-dependent dehydrogenase (short-subunit alcohol dehydrogenase family) [Williamsia limnetica]|jgi:NAD(P)-dependent dehydrogenase (short-subunit alcohol dehydrogenase family)|uniref:NAD(P)-dependent dehydrogenase (Short-subunit alcohol dehydrogenase family) n=1 Tax=Williamsia limnetica TaxID=882452 RepID=A0A318RZW9_WILLI|nr:SDR family oxidoreductase [Williamsia limnetica]PYE16274.1 NAD(P)-dependent dehydrogenase (short-subunit alcohol dehydrogenase family) [Williamsia limnetica]
MQLEGKTIIITGAGSGVGRASAILFAEEGGNVVCADVNDEWAKETVRLVEQNGGNSIAVHCDVTSEADVTAAIDATVAEYGRLDVMYNNAGVATPRPGLRFEDHTVEDFDRLMSINLKGVFLGTKYAVLQFKKQSTPGSIVNTASVAGIVGWGGTVYGATKGGVIQLTRAVAVEAAPFDIRVNAVCPAGMPTTNFMDIPTDTATQAVAFEKVAQQHPLGRNITPEDVAAAALFFASDTARNVTGVVLPVDGGYVAR